MQISSDGYIRLTRQQLDEITLTHLTTGLDEDGPDLATAGAAPTAIAGYTEWLSSPAGITIGWDWKMDVVDRKVVLRRVDTPRSNVLLLDDDGNDLTPAASQQGLAAFVDRIDWQAEAIACLNSRYQL